MLHGRIHFVASNLNFLRQFSNQMRSPLDDANQRQLPHKHSRHNVVLDFFPKKKKKERNARQEHIILLRFLYNYLETYVTLNK